MEIGVSPCVCKRGLKDPLPSHLSPLGLPLLNAGSLPSQEF